MAEQEAQQAMEQAQREQDLKVLGLLDTADPNSEMIANDILSRLGYAPQTTTPIGTSGYMGDWQSRQAEAMSLAPTMQDYNRFQAMANFTPEQVSAYEAPISLSERINAGGLLGLLNPRAYAGDTIRGQRVGLGGY